MLPKSLKERRSGVDRRHLHLRAFLYQFSNQRRHSDRRSRSTQSYVDVHEPGLLLITLSALLLCIVDSYNTLLLLDLGGSELNPVMRELLDRDATLFFVVKYTLTAFCLMVLVVHKRFFLLKFVSGHTVIVAVLCGYAVLIAYQYSLLASI